MKDKLFNVLVLFEDLSGRIIEKEQVDMMLVDFQAAFDKFP